MSKASSKTNHEIISIIANAKGFSYNGDNIDTFGGWKQRGFNIVKGEKMFAQTRLWSKGINRRFILKNLFTIEQVAEMEVNVEMSISV